jgi:hypothetical protein
MKSIEMLSIPEVFNKNTVINNLKEKMTIRKDCIYMCFSRVEEEMGTNVYKVRDKLYSYDKIFKLKFSEGHLKIEYHGVIDDNITNFIHNFLKDYEDFIKGKFIKKCMRQSLLQLKKIKPNSAKSGKRRKSNLKYQEISLDKFLKSSKAPEEPPKIMEEKISQVSEETKPSFDNVELFKSEIVNSAPKNVEVKKYQSEIYSPKKEEKSESIIPSNISTMSISLIDQCNLLIKDINEPEIDLSFDDIKDKKKELKIYSNFLKKYKNYKKYVNQKSVWKEEKSNENMTIWSRIDAPYMVRKVTITASLDPELLETTMNNYSLASKWNPMLGKGFFDN